MFIYTIMNTKNNKVYVGSTTQYNPLQRLYAHYRLLLRNKHRNPLLQKAWNENPTAFVFNIVERVEIGENVGDREDFYIQCLESRNPKYGYNMTGGGCNRTVDPYMIELANQTPARLPDGCGLTI